MTECGCVMGSGDGRRVWKQSAVGGVTTAIGTSTQGCCSESAPARIHCGGPRGRDSLAVGIERWCCSEPTSAVACRIRF